MKSIVLVFAKTPISGTVKTRLAFVIGNKKALWIYKKLLYKTDSELKKLSQDVVVFYHGGPSTIFKKIFLAFQKKSQLGEDLGERMKSAFQWGFDKGYEKILIIGTDLWDLSKPLLENAFKQLDSNDYVIGPASDGGYYLLGCKKFTKHLFTEKKWGSPDVYHQTMKELMGKSVAILDEKKDIDTLEDLEQSPELYNKFKNEFSER
jgi:rSAM/selenodomain-associated transferase 1